MRLINNWRSRLLSALLLILVAASQAPAEEWDLGGYLKNIIIFGDTLLDEGYDLITHRLRFRTVYFPVPSLELHAELDNQVKWGSYLDTQQYALSRPYQDLSYYDLTIEPYEGDSVVWQAKVHRLYMRSTSDTLDLTIGRQRIAWGTGRIWNPTDLFNPVSPLTIEPGEKTGADAVHVAIRPTETLQVELAGSIGTNDTDTRYAVRTRTSVGSYEISAMAGTFGTRTVIGGDFTGYIGDAGFRGEMTWTDAETSDFVQAMLSYEYTFPSEITVLVEYLYNGGALGEYSPLHFDDYVTYNSIITMNRHFLGTRVSWQPHPLVGASVMSITDLEDYSFFLFPMVTYNWKQNIDITAGVQLFIGDEGEYARYNNTGLISIDLYF